MGIAAAGSTAHAAIVYANLNSNVVSGSDSVIYAATGSVYVIHLGMTGNSIGVDTDGNNGIGFSNGSETVHETPFESWTETTEARIYATNANLMEITSSLLSFGSTVNGSSSLAGWDSLNPADSSAELYVGAAAKSGGYSYYGWIGFTLDAGVFTLKEAAFNSTAGEGITVGQTSSFISAVPEASTSLGLLALGAGGLFTRRRLKRKA